MLTSDTRAFFEQEIDDAGGQYFDHNLAAGFGVA